MSDRFRLFGAVYLLLVRDKKVLLARRANTSWRNGWLSLPSGHLDGEETPREAMAREAREEIGVEISIDDLHFVTVSHHCDHGTGREYVDFYFSAEKWSGEVVNAEPEKCGELVWSEVKNLPEKIIPNVKRAIESLQGSAEKYFEIGF